MPDLKCYACEREPTQQCPRCGRPYCDEHGEDFCNVCLEPSSGVPSVNLYRGSLLALIIGASVAIWLIIQPSSDSGASALRPPVITATAPSGTSSLTTPAAGSPQPQATTGAAATVPAGATARPGTTATAVASGTTTTGVYVVVGGDTLSLICSDKIRRPASMTVSDCVDQIKSLNSLTSDNISVGQQLKVPQ